MGSAYKKLLPFRASKYYYTIIASAELSKLSADLTTTIQPKSNEPTIARLGKHGKSRVSFVLVYVPESQRRVTLI